MTYSLLTNRPGGGMQARDEAGWHDVQDGDCLDFGNGRIVQVMGPDQLAGGSLKAAALSLLLGFLGLGIAGLLGWGKS